LKFFCFFVFEKLNEKRRRIFTHSHTPNTSIDMSDAPRILPARPVTLHELEVPCPPRCFTCTDVINGKTQAYDVLANPTQQPQQQQNAHDHNAGTPNHSKQRPRKVYSKTNALLASGSSAFCCNRMILAESDVAP